MLTVLDPYLNLNNARNAREDAADRERIKLSTQTLSFLL